jgi:large subunit ribosomal protein L6
MSRVGRVPVEVPDGVEVEIDGSRVTVAGPRGELTQEFDPDMEIVHEDGEVKVSRPTDRTHHRALHGLTRSLLSNMVTGVTEGYEKSLEIHGVGYRAESRGGTLILNLGFSHEVEIDVPEGIDIEVESPTLLHVRGVDKQLVGETAARIRQVRPPEPYKGKGIRYVDEQVRRKAGKATAGGTGAGAI